MFPTHLKVLPQLLPGIAPPESICAQHDQGARDEFPQLIRVCLLVISRSDKRALLSGELLREVILDENGNDVDDDSWLPDM